MNQVGKHIKKLRTAQGMTQDYLAEKLFVSRQTVSNYETGRSCPDIDMLLAIAEALGVDAGQLIYGPSPAPDRQKRKRQLVRLAVLACVTGLLGVFSFYLFRLGKEPTTVFSSLNYVCLLVLWPGFYLLLGRTILETAELLFGAKRPQGRWVPYVRRGLWGLLAVYLFLTIPNLTDLAISQWKSRNAISFSWKSRNIPVYSWFADQLWFFACVYDKVFYALFFLLGLVSWVVKKEKSPAPEPETETKTEP